MCKVKSGVNIKNKSDLQNMIIGIILRQSKQYNEREIYKAVMYHSKNAQIAINSDYVKNMINDNLDFLIRCKKVSCMDGVYTPLYIPYQISNY